MIYCASLKKFHHHCVLLATLQMKRRCITSILTILQSDFGTNFNILFCQYLYIPEINQRHALLGFLNIGSQQQNFLLINHLLLIFKHFLYMSREHGAVCFTSLKLYLIKIKTIEQNISPCKGQKKEKCRLK